jgi:hypothetical protein
LNGCSLVSGFDSDIQRVNKILLYIFRIKLLTLHFFGSAWIQLCGVKTVV